MFLDEPTLGLTRARPQQRAGRWPQSTNPHLLVTQVTAVDLNNLPISQFGIRRILQPTGLTLAA